MKRSEMIDLIVYEALSWDGLETSGISLEEIADDVLKVIEKHGMLPPDRLHPEIPKNMSHLKWSCEKAKEELYNYHNLPDKYTINTWEEE